ncbi:MAG: hypothetical protein M1407_04850 [Deltaproteobacteria bacterium]|nr:hypothetical protein [Deltaproteobacteria bacterium]
MKNQTVQISNNIYLDNDLIKLLYFYHRIFSQFKSIKQSAVKKIFKKIIKSYIIDNNHYNNFNYYSDIAKILENTALETYKINKNIFGKSKKIAENESNVLDKFNIIPFLNIYNDSLPIFLYYYNINKKEALEKTAALACNINHISKKINNIYPNDEYFDEYNINGINNNCGSNITNNDINNNNKFIFITSSRYKDAGIFRLNDYSSNCSSNCLSGYLISCNNLNSLSDVSCNFNKLDESINTSYFIGTASESENNLIKNYDKVFKDKNKIILAPHYPMIHFLKNYSRYSDFSAISATDPFETNFKYCYIYRNNLILNISSEMIVLYLSKKSSLNNLIKKFENLNKNVNIIEKFIEKNKIADDNNNTNIINIKDDDVINTIDPDIYIIDKNENINKLQYIEKAILSFLDYNYKKNNNINITADDIINNLIKIVQKINKNDTNQIKKMILQSISLMEIKGVIKREISGVIKKI